MTKILIGKNALDNQEHFFNLSKANRHGLITGATGTGKTVTLQKLAESFSANGTAVFMADIKGDLSGLSKFGKIGSNAEIKSKEINVDFIPNKFPVEFWDLFEEFGTPIKTTVSAIGPLLLARMLELTEAQEGIINIVFKMAKEQNILITNFDDLRNFLQLLLDNAEDFIHLGNISPASIGAIQRRLLVLENQGIANFFGNPQFDVADFLLRDEKGYGKINILTADSLMESPRFYSVFLLWLLTELFNLLPEIGDTKKPKMVFFFDEAHLLFDNAPANLIKAVERVVRLIRSKGIGVYFVTQKPTDIPNQILAQLSNKIQHALRAFTDKDIKDIKATAKGFRPNPNLNLESEIKSLSVGEAIVSFLSDSGEPEISQKVKIIPPSAQIGPINQEERKEILKNSVLNKKYTSYKQENFSMIAKRQDDYQENFLSKIIKNDLVKNFLPDILHICFGRKISKSLIRSVLKIF